ncbi:MAG: DUF4097 family beta strand repeat-containing protein [Bacteroidota bacterium]
MKTIKIVAAFVLTMILSGQAMAKQATEQKEQLVVPLSEPGKPFKLNVGLINGSIKVTGYEGKDVVIDISSDDKRKGDRKESANGMKRINAGNGMDISAEEKNNSVTVHSQSWSSSVRLSIKVPMSESKMKLSTINDGDVVVSNVNGELEVSNSNGDVQLNNISGFAVANSLNGDVVVSFKTIDLKAAMAFSTLNGKIDVTFPAALKANVKLKSDHGDIYTDFDVDADKAAAAPTKSASSGTYRVKIDNTVYGKIGGGGPEVMMKNMNGNIYIRKAKG